MESGAYQEIGGDVATVVISLKVGEGKEDDYRRWQARVTDTVRGFTGFEDAELHQPDSGEENVWVVVYRFSGVERLTAWLDSGVRRELIEEGRPLFEEDPRQEVLVGEAPARDVVTAVISHEVRPGREWDFRRWQERVRRAQEGFPGFMGSELFEPVPGVQEKWVTAIRFDTREHLDRWLESEVRGRLLEEGSGYYTGYDVQKVGSAFSGWFRFDGGAEGGVPPNWKQAMSVLLALYPTVMILNLTVSRALQKAGVPPYLDLFIGNALSVSFLTWLAMPLVNRALGFWLAPAGREPAAVRLAGIAVVVLCYLLSVVVFGVITT